MYDRMSMWLGTGLITAGMSASLLFGAGVAVAATEPAGGGETSTSAGAVSAGSRTEPDTAGPDTESDNSDTDSDTSDDSEVEDRQADKPAAQPEPTDDAGDDTAEADDAADEADDTADEAPEQLDVTADERDRDGTTTPDAAEQAIATPEPAVDEPQLVADATNESQPAAQPERLASEGDVSVAEPAARAVEAAEPTIAQARLAMVPAADDGSELAAAATAPRQTLLSVVSTVISNLYSAAIRVFGGPPLLPWGSTVTVRSSSVTIDCGDGYEVPADWYVPEGPTPTELIYLQHGFLAAGPFYSYTASRLAEATHSIVVTTTLTSNFLACDGCWVGGSPMHKAVADLFLDGSTSLADSASAAGYSAALLTGVEKVVLIGHSAGGGLAAGAAGYMTENGTIDRLAGVVMLDGVGFGSVVPVALATLPDNLPIYNLSGKSYFWNLSGSSNTALETARPGEFYGVRLVGGLHSDSMAGGNIFVQTGLYLVTGFSKPQNVKAAEILSAAWIDDMFAGTAPTDGPLPESPYYGSSGKLLQIDTPRGPAEAYVSPGPEERLTLLDSVFTFFSNVVFGINFATCVAPSAENAPISAPNTLLSLDGRTKAGQSIAQHVCMG